MAGDDKTERATPKRREDARKEGNVLRSMEVNSAFAMLAAFGVLTIWGPKMWSRMQNDMVHRLQSLGSAGTKAFTIEDTMSLFFDGMQVNLHAEDCLDRIIKVSFDFPDSGEQYSYIIRHGASEVVKGSLPDADIVVKIPAQTFKEMLAKLRNPALTLAKDAEVTKGSKIDFLKFMALFQPPSQ